MQTKITNRSDRQVLLRLKSGVTRRLAPGEVADDVEPVDVLGNARLAHLDAKGLITIELPEPKAARGKRGAAPARPKKRSIRASRRGTSGGGRAAPATKPTAES